MGSLKLMTKQFCDSKFKQFSDSSIADIHGKLNRFVGQNAIAESTVNVYSCLQYVANAPYGE